MKMMNGLVNVTIFVEEDKTYDEAHDKLVEVLNMMNGKAEWWLESTIMTEE